MDIKELLENAEIKEALELELNAMLESQKTALEEAKAEVEKQKKIVEREAFIARKALVHKVGLYEKHLTEHYEAQYVAFTKRLANDTFKYVQENLDRTINAIAADAKANTKAAQIQEALSKTVRLLAPHMDLSEAIQTSNEEVNKLRDELNKALKVTKGLEENAKKHEVEAAILRESADLPKEDRLLFTESVKRMGLTTAADVVTAAVKVKEAIEKRKADAVLEAATAMLKEKQTVTVTEGVEPTKVKLGIPAKKTYDSMTSLLPK